ncbi:MAG: 50S ribosomal protein L9 [Oscillospiraceae bacterium]|jgi:large subunit ribosomal protein L9|nr:50S ribosomal protein L9 [Oscillospiraceae bacterium]
MKVILEQDVKDQGKKGQMIEVSDGYARNYLLPRKLASKATEDNVNAMKQREKARARRAEAEKKEAEEIAAKLEGIQVKISAKAGGAGKLFGAVTSKEISQALLEQHGIAIEKNKIVLAEHIKAFGAYAVKCKLGYETTGTINIIVIQNSQ